MAEDKKTMVMPKIFAGAAARPKPAGWWSLPGHEFDGSREGVLRAIASATFTEQVDGKAVVKPVPSRWREHIAEEIGEMAPEFNHVTVNVHVSIHISRDGKMHQRTYDFDITGRIKL